MNKHVNVPFYSIYPIALFIICNILRFLRIVCLAKTIVKNKKPTSLFAARNLFTFNKIKIILPSINACTIRENGTARQYGTDCRHTSIISGTYWKTFL